MTDSQLKSYAITVVFIVGWSSEPDIHDEPQHIYQEEVTIKLLENMRIKTFIISKDTAYEEVAAVMEDYKNILAEWKDAAFVIRKYAISYDENEIYPIVEIGTVDGIC